MAEQEQTFPATNINVSPAGMTITIMLAPGLAIQQAVGEEAMNQIMQKWLETRKQVRQQLELVKHIQQSRND